MQHLPGDDTVHVHQGHSLQHRDDHDVFQCDACGSCYFSVSGASPDDWCDR